MNYCRKCGKEIDGPSNLWCKECKELVNQEFRRETSRPYNFYFDYYIKNVKYKPTTDESKVYRLLKRNNKERTKS